MCPVALEAEGGGGDKPHGSFGRGVVRTCWGDGWLHSEKSCYGKPKLMVYSTSYLLAMNKIM